jgi:hypothetical protein
MIFTPASTMVPKRRIDPDRLGVMASVLCAIHCAVTPLILLFAPAFGQIWAHPASHWIVALLVVPLAAVTMAQGFRKHRRISVMVAGIAGVTLVVAGAAIPNWSKQVSYVLGPVTLSQTAAEVSIPVVSDDDACESSGNGTTAVVETSGTDNCSIDNCCPSLAVDESGETRLVIPLASAVTTFGGLLLIVAHVGNLCCCAACQTPLHKSSVLK